MDCELLRQRSLCRARTATVITTRCFQGFSLVTPAFGRDSVDQACARLSDNNAYKGVTPSTDPRTVPYIPGTLLPPTTHMTNLRLGATFRSWDISIYSTNLTNSFPMLSNQPPPPPPPSDHPCAQTTLGPSHDRNYGNRQVLSQAQAGAADSGTHYLPRSIKGEFQCVCARDTGFQS